MNTSELELSKEPKKKAYLVGVIGAGEVSTLAERIGCKESEIEIVEKIEDVPNETIFPIKNFEIEPFVFTQPYAFDSEYRRKKKPKNENWQNRIRNLQRRT